MCAVVTPPLCAICEKLFKTCTVQLRYRWSRFPGQSYSFILITRNGVIMTRCAMRSFRLDFKLAHEKRASDHEATGRHNQEWRHPLDENQADRRADRFLPWFVESNSLRPGDF